MFDICYVFIPDDQFVNIMVSESCVLHGIVRLIIPECLFVRIDLHFVDIESEFDITFVWQFR